MPGKGSEVAAENRVIGLHFPLWYDPNSPEVIERRRRLFEAIDAGYTKQGEDAMERLARESHDDSDEALK